MSRFTAWLFGAGVVAAGLAGGAVVGPAGVVGATAIAPLGPTYAGGAGAPEQGRAASQGVRGGRTPRSGGPRRRSYGKKAARVGKRTGPSQRQRVRRKQTNRRRW